MKFFNILFIISTFLFLEGCKKVELAEIKSTGEGIDATSFRLVTPSSPDSIMLNAAIANKTISFSWGAAKKGVNAPITYKLVATLKSANNFSNPILSIASESQGAATTAAVSYQQIDDALKNSGIAAGARAELLWSVVADNGDVTVLPNNAHILIVYRMKDGASPFYLLEPSSSTAALELSPTSTTDMYKFNWTKSYPATGGSAIKYKLLFAERKVDENGAELAVNWATQTLFSIASNSSGVDSLLTISHKQFNDSLVKSGFSDYSKNPVLKWTVVAVSGTWNQQSEYTNSLSVSRLVKYVYPQALNVAGSFQGWSPATAPQLVAMAPVGGPYSDYAGFIDFGSSASEFKIVKGNDWSAGDYGMVDATTIGNGGNFSLSSGGVYFFKVNTTAMSWSATKINSFGLIGDATGSWDSDKDMTYDAATQKWSITLPLTAGAIKFRANDSWDLNLGDDGPDGMLELNGANISVTSAGTYTVTLSINNGGNWRYSVVKN